MGLEDFERELVQNKASKAGRKRSRSPGVEKQSTRKHRGHRRAPQHHNISPLPYKQSRSTEAEIDRCGPHHSAPFTTPFVRKDSTSVVTEAQERDLWMRNPFALDIDRVQRKQDVRPVAQGDRGDDKGSGTPVNAAQMSTLSQDIISREGDPDTGSEVSESAGNDDFVFGDAGAHWRMTKLKGVFSLAQASKRSVDEVALERYGNIRGFDLAREEETELAQRKIYGQDYIGKNNSSSGVHTPSPAKCGIVTDNRESSPRRSDVHLEAPQAQSILEKSDPLVVLDQTALNRLKAHMMRAKLRGAPDAPRLEAEFNAAIAVANARPPGLVVLDKMENRMLAGGRKGEVNITETKRGREKGTVTANEAMSIEDMMRYEKRTRGEHGGEGKAFAERIAKDSKFDNNLDYLDENAVKLSKHIAKSDINLRNTAVADYQKTRQVLSTCLLCHHEDTSTPPQAPVVSLATRVYMTLPPSPEITPYGLCATIVPIEHHRNLLECDDDEWEEIRNFMKSLSRFYHAQKPPYTVVFYENATETGRKRHATLEAIPLPVHVGNTAPAFFREAILAADEEWTQHRKLIDTLGKAEKDGLSKHAFRRSLVSELPYFHVWFTLDGGYGHIIEDWRRWPKGDLFAREVVGGMLDVNAEVIKRQGRWRTGDREMDRRVRDFRLGWKPWDWTTVLVES